jgi:hypothetical protein
MSLKGETPSGRAHREKRPPKMKAQKMKQMGAAKLPVHDD